jgi:hypothetical protein
MLNRFNNNIFYINHYSYTIFKITIIDFSEATVVVESRLRLAPVDNHEIKLKPCSMLNGPRHEIES